MWAELKRGTSYLGVLVEAVRYRGCSWSDPKERRIWRGSTIEFDALYKAELPKVQTGGVMVPS